MGSLFYLSISDFKRDGRREFSDW